MIVRVRIEVVGNYLVEGGRNFEVEEAFEIYTGNKTASQVEKFRNEIVERVGELLKVGGLE